MLRTLAPVSSTTISNTLKLSKARLWIGEKKKTPQLSRLEGFWFVHGGGRESLAGRGPGRSAAYASAMAMPAPMPEVLFRPEMVSWIRGLWFRAGESLLRFMWRLSYVVGGTVGWNAG